MSRQTTRETVENVWYSEANVNAINEYKVTKVKRERRRKQYVKILVRVCTIVKLSCAIDKA
jgi:hypothetical protein